NQDKATPSLIGDVPKGALLNQAPIFLGGQGGLVGPCRITFGTILGAGSLCRNDQLTPNRLVFEGNATKGSIPFKSGIYRNVNRVLVNNFYYLGNLFALGQWYRHVRIRFIGTEMPELLYEGLLATMDVAVNERISQLGRLARKMKSGAGEGSLQQQFATRWEEIEASLGQLYENEGNASAKDGFLSELDNHVLKGGAVYLDTIHRLNQHQAELGTNWLETIVEAVLGKMAEILPLLKI
ncbi:MAG: hypothetical protein P8X55_06135, partial [Desulfosarcinaceae bacterium]